MRSINAVHNRIMETREDDWMGWRSEVLLLVVGDGEPPETAVREDAVDYLKFAFGKVTDHRGTSCLRSVVKVREFLWLLELETAGFDAAPYSMYGAPKLIVAAGLLGVPVPVDDLRFMRMAMGNVCADDCNACANNPMADANQEEVSV